MQPPLPHVTLLVTAFGAFPGARSNPTVEIIRRLARNKRFARLGLRVETRVLPVEFTRISASLVLQEPVGAEKFRKLRRPSDS